MNPKLILGAVILSLIAGAYLYGRHDGRALERSAVSEAVNKHQARENELIEELENAKAKREVIFRDRIKTIQQAQGDWYVQPLPADLAARLRDEIFP